MGCCAAASAGAAAAAAALAGSSLHTGLWLRHAALEHSALQKYAVRHPEQRFGRTSASLAPTRLVQPMLVQRRISASAWTLCTACTPCCCAIGNTVRAVLPMTGSLATACSIRCQWSASAGLHKGSSRPVPSTRMSSTHCRSFSHCSSLRHSVQNAGVGVRARQKGVAMALSCCSQSASQSGSQAGRQHAHASQPAAQPSRKLGRQESYSKRTKAGGQVCETSTKTGGLRGLAGRQAGQHAGSRASSRVGHAGAAHHAHLLDGSRVTASMISPAKHVQPARLFSCVSAAEPIAALPTAALPDSLPRCAWSASSSTARLQAVEANEASRARKRSAAATSRRGRCAFIQLCKYCKPPLAP